MAEPNFDAKVMKGMAKVLKKFKVNLTKKEKQHLVGFSYKIIKLCTYYWTIRFKIAAGPICPTKPFFKTFSSTC